MRLTDSIELLEMIIVVMTLFQYIISSMVDKRNLQRLENNKVRSISACTPLAPVGQFKVIV